MTRPPTFLPLALLLAGTLALAGCGGGGADGGSAADGGGGGTTTTEASAPEEDADPSSVAYQGAYELCAAESVESIAATYGIDPPTNDAVADAIAEQVAGGLSPGEVEQGRLGCLAGLEAGS
jgi:hypothetical protein